MMNGFENSGEHALHSREGGRQIARTVLNGFRSLRRWLRTSAPAVRGDDRGSAFLAGPSFLQQEPDLAKEAASRRLHT